MDWGLANRLNLIIRPETGRTVMLAVDHGYFQGPTTGLEQPRATLAPLLPYADTIMLTRGVLRSCIEPSSATPVVLRVSGGTSILRELSHEGVTTCMEEALRLNAVAVAHSIFVGGEGERESLLNLGKLVDEGMRWGMPVLAVTAVGREMVRDARYLALASRIAAELGASVVKTYYCDDFEKVVAGCPVPVVIAGGKKLAEYEAIKVTYNAIKNGAVGVDMGRNIFQSEAPVAMLRAVRAIVHEKKSAGQAFALFEKLKNAAHA
ncbi:MAG: 3-hydroxy-5-phosphonooxypentane-2,4-dione thiolase [Deltaproteobacteria bacterium]|nr:3-hydroxy-5-phosphonooxypentane-2,4-dione thiolase [Deltaproteobacteria bacterium]